jgi:zinc protease
MNSRNLFKIFIVFFAVTACNLTHTTAIDAQTGPPKQEKLLNGLKVLMWPDPTADNVSMRIRLHSGSAFDPLGKEGVMQLLADNFFPNEVSREFFTEDLGGSLEVAATYDYIEVRASSKPENFLTMLETVSTAVSNPQIDKEITARLRSSLVRRLEELQSDPGYVADTAIAHRLFGTFPYGRPQMGSVESVRRIDFADLIDARQKFVTADNATIVVTGNFDRALGFRGIRRYFGSWLKSDRKIPSTFKQPEAPPAETLILKSSDRQNAEVRYALRGPARGDKDFAVSQVYAAVIQSRLKARAPEAHAADVFVSNNAHILPGSIVIGFSAGQNEVGQAPGKVTVTDLIAKTLADPITEEELQAARAAAKTEWSKRDIPSLWLDADTYKIPKPETDPRVFDAISLAEIRAYAERIRTQPVASVLVESSRKSE